MIPERLNFTEDYVFHTVQGEGKFVGVPSVFVRLSGCNLRCEWSNPDGTTTQCDTAYSSHTPERNIQAIDVTIQKVSRYNCKHVVITGGEPMQQPHVGVLIDSLVQLGHHVTVETNGTIFRMTQASFLSISPKLQSSCVPGSPHFVKHQKERLALATLAVMTRKPHQLKFVVNTETDILEIEDLLLKIENHDGRVLPENIYLMPQGVSAEQFDSKLPWIIEEAKKRNWNITDRLHVRIWGHKRGV